ncbi:MAG TPA: FIST N-terminal domain-containing protein [Actinomycetes bacterium]|nr:FIST N-terminal domain-containing protein [Actinomycetes bacterium]
MLQFGAAVSTAPDSEQAVREAAAAALGGFDGPPDLVVCFYSMDHVDATARLGSWLVERAGTPNVIGCTAQGVIGDGRELEDGPGLALWAGRMTGVDVRTFGLGVVQLDDERLAVAGWPGVGDGGRRSALLLGDPFTFPADEFVRRLDEQHPDMTVAGAMVSGAFQPGRHRLLHGEEVLDAGAVGVVLSGDVEVRAVVSQGCRPIGQPYAVTRGEGSVVAELGGRPAMERLRELLDTLDSREQALLRLGGLQVGQVIDEHKDHFDRGDFLIRGLEGVNPDSGAIVLADAVELGQTLQFHLRDASAAGEELDELLAPVRAWNPRSVLLFSCNGRGRNFFDVPDHDAGKVRSATGAVPMAGFFAQGELGPVGGHTFLHTFTASLAVFCEPDAAAPAVPAAEAQEQVPVDAGTDAPRDAPRPRREPERA